MLSHVSALHPFVMAESRESSWKRERESQKKRKVYLFFSTKVTVLRILNFIVFFLKILNQTEFPQLLVHSQMPITVDRDWSTLKPETQNLMLISLLAIHLLPSDYALVRHWS